MSVLRYAFLLSASTALGCHAGSTSDGPTDASEPVAVATDAATDAAADAGGDGPATADGSAAGCELTIDLGHRLHVEGWCVDQVGGLALSPTAVAFVTFWSEKPGATTLSLFDRATGARTFLLGQSGDPHPTGGLANGGDELFFPGCGAATCGIYAVPWAGGAPRMVTALDVPDASSPFYAAPAIAVDAASVYWVDRDLHAAPRAGGAARLLATGVTSQGQGGTLAVSGDAVYVASASDGTITKVPLDGGAPSLLADKETGPDAIVVAGASVAWKNGGTVQTDCTPSDGALRVFESGATTTLLGPIAGVGSLTTSGDRLLMTSSGPQCNSDKATGFVELVTGTNAVTTVASQLLDPGNAVADTHDAYWVVSSSWDGKAVIMHASLP